jgi:solute carrier family 25 carnitine/acylcarnitine transporter 20/29
MTSPLELAKDLFCGCMSGWGQVISMLPFENIKIKVISKPQEYNQGYVHAFTKTIQEEGFLSLYKGMLFPLLGVGAQVSVQFGFVESLKKLMKTRYADSEGNLPAIYSFYSGLICGLPSALIVVRLSPRRPPSTTLVSR